MNFLALSGFLPAISEFSLKNMMRPKSRRLAEEWAASPGQALFRRRE
jgi:hypothetical protein